VSEAEHDRQLLVAWCAGDRRAGNRLFRRHVRSISNFLRSKLDTGADDLTQRTFLALLEAPDRFRQEASVRTYLFAIARRRLLMHLRARSYERRRFDPATCSMLDAGVSPARGIAHAQEHALLADALRCIPVDYQVALELHYFEDLPLAEIAIVLEQPVGTIKSRLSRGRKLLHEVLAARAESAEILASVSEDLERWMRSLPAAIPHAVESSNEP
jgi:RNA polymerase sigma factor (sigma-70 family)